MWKFKVFSSDYAFVFRGGKIVPFLDQKRNNDINRGFIKTFRLKIIHQGRKLW